MYCGLWLFPPPLLILDITKSWRWEQPGNKIILFSSGILSTLQKWAWAFRDNEYHCAVDTNNGVEAQNKLLKYSYLPNRKNITLSSLVSHIIESFLPDRYQKYLLQNYQMTEAYRSYSDIIPDYLRTRPRSVIIHCLDRVRKANKFSSTDVQEGESEGCFNVTSQSGKVHHVDLGVTSQPPRAHAWTGFDIIFHANISLPSSSIIPCGLGIPCPRRIFKVHTLVVTLKL